MFWTSDNPINNGNYEVMDALQKNELKRDLARRLAQAQEIRKVVVFGSFLYNDAPDDMDVAVFQDSSEDYLSLALKYRRLATPVAAHIPLDIIPLRPGASGCFVDEINRGEVIYER